MKKYLLSLLLVIPALAASAQAKIGKQVITSAALQTLDSLFRYLEANNLYNGNILVATGGHPVRQMSLGYSNLETGERLTENSPFELASVSKQFTAVGVLRLAAAGKIALDQQVATIIPGFPYKGVTVRHLLNHTGGLPDYMELFEAHWDKSKIAENRDVISMLKQYKPKVLFPPGTKWMYSNTGYAVLANVIEQVSGKSFADYMQAEVFGPLHLAHTFIWSRRLHPKDIPGYAYGYVKDSNGRYDLPDRIKDYEMVRYLDGIQGDGTVNTTLGDLLIWNNAIKEGKLLPAALWQQALTPAKLPDGSSTDYGFGWMVVQNPERGKVIRHTGGWPGYSTFVSHYLDKEVLLVFLGNKEGDGAITQGIYDAVKNIVFGLPYEFPKLKKAVAIDKQLYALYTGSYESEEQKGFMVDVLVKDGQLYAQATGQGQIELMPESETVFFVPDLPISFEFKAKDGSKADAFVLHQNGLHTFKRK